MKFNEKLIELRKKEGLSQEELGYKLNVTRQTVSKWELGQTTPEMDKLSEIANIFGVSVDNLLNEQESINTEEIKIEDKKIEKSNNTGKKAALIILGIIAVLAIILIMFFVMVFKNFSNFRNRFFDLAEKIVTKDIQLMDNITDNINEQGTNILKEEKNHININDIKNQIEENYNTNIENTQELTTNKFEQKSNEIKEEYNTKVEEIKEEYNTKVEEMKQQTNEAIQKQQQTMEEFKKQQQTIQK